MGFHISSFSVGGRSCWAWVPEYVGEGQRLPLVILPGEGEMVEMLPAVLKGVEAAILGGSGRPFVLAGFESADWNRDFTPWPAPPLSGKGAPFPGEGEKTLGWVLGSFLPEVEGVWPVIPHRTGRSILGYSLGGLFALWALLKSGEFSGCASCSGSLWYDGWADFARVNPAPSGSRVYLSLGRAEEKARNPRMAAVGDATRGYADELRVDRNIAETVLVWQDGGHFQDVPKRLGDALLWLMKTGPAGAENGGGYGLV